MPPRQSPFRMREAHSDPRESSIPANRFRSTAASSGSSRERRTKNQELMETKTPNPLYQWLWRWHGYAGLFVIPFIFWMALTGLPYVWEYEIEDAFHPEFRALTSSGPRLTYEQQLAAARPSAEGAPLLRVLTDSNPAHATQF